VSLKLSQGAKPGVGGVLPGPKVTAEIAKARNVPQGQTCVSPDSHRVFSTPRELIRFIARMRELAGGKPAGFKLCVGTRRDVLAICKAMLAEGTAPDFIIADGAEGGTVAAPPEYSDHVGTALTEGLMTVHNALVGVGLREQVKIGAAGKVATGVDIVKRTRRVAVVRGAARPDRRAGGSKGQRADQSGSDGGGKHQVPWLSSAAVALEFGELGGSLRVVTRGPGLREHPDATRGHGQAEDTDGDPQRIHGHGLPEDCDPEQDRD
jgi:hypothetical protein